MHVMNAHDLLTASLSPASQAAPPTGQAPIIPDALQPLHQALQTAPDNILAQAAWDAYLALYAPVSPRSPQLPELRTRYLPQVWALLAAAHWEEDGTLVDAGPIPPTSIPDCTQDIDRDDQPECILASSQVFAVIELQGGMLTFAFSRTTSGIHQWVGPSSQFITGLSEPVSWNLSKGALADPAVIPGAFTETLTPLNPLISPGQIAFLLPDLAIQKTYRLDGAALVVEYTAGSSLRTNIPFAFDPWSRFASGWSSLYEQPPPWIDLNLTASQATSFTFTITQAAFSGPENPNHDYPPGHFLPFPLTLVEIFHSGAGPVRIEISPND